MKGLVYYNRTEAERNKAFIADLLEEARRLDMELRLLLDDEQPDANADFILFRSRDNRKAISFEKAGFRLFNRSEVNRIANDKHQTFELSTLLGIPAIPTKKVQQPEDISTAYPVVLKTVDGHGGDEVFLCRTPVEAEAFFQRFPHRQLIVQPYIESGAQDIRVFVIGNEVAGAVKRTGNDSFKSNYTLGGSIEKYTLAAWQEKEALTIARALKSDYIGIDFLSTPDGGWLLNEIEDPVGARSLYATHDFSVAQKLLEHIKDQLNA